MNFQERRSLPDSEPTFWPPAPTQQPDLETDELETDEQEFEQGNYLTRYKAGDIVLGLLAGIITHFLSWVAFLAVMETMGQIHPTPEAPLSSNLFYGAWVFAVVVGISLVVFLRRYPVLVIGLFIGMVPAAALSLFGTWFGSGIAD